MPTPRVGAQASATRTGTEGRCLVKDGDGRVNVWASPWYSLKCGVKSGHETLDPYNIEALAGDSLGKQRQRITTVPSWTDNPGNGSFLDKLMNEYQVPVHGGTDGACREHEIYAAMSCRRVDVKRV